jgi:uncharacterized protein YprB with RNaseH-like and TPR domain
MVKRIFLDIETTGLNPIECQLTCICAILEDENENVIDSFSCTADLSKKHSEYTIYYEFKKWCVFNGLTYSEDDNLDIELVTKNGLQFDLPFLFTRKCKLIAPSIDFMFQWKNIDLQNYTKGRVSLSDMALLLGVENKSGNGLDAIKLFYDSKYEELSSYCMQDVRVTQQCYHAMRRLGIIGENNG